MNIKEKLKAEWDKTIKVLGLKFDAVSDSTDAKVLTPDEVQLSDKVVGAKVELVNADGSLSVAPDGDYQLADGDFAFTVKDGLIASIEGQDAPTDTPVGEDLAKVETPAPATAPTDAPADKPAPTDDLQKEVDGLKQELETLKQAIEDLKVGSQKSNENMEKFSKDVDETKEVIIKLAKLPAQPAQTTKSNVVKDSNKDKMNDLITFFAKKK